MRYLILAAAGALGLIFTGAVFVNINIEGISPDLIICIITSIAILEKSMTGAWLGLASGLLLDVMFSGSIGFYALPYMIAGAVVYFVMQKFRYLGKVLFPTILAMGAFIIKELVAALLSYMMGIGFSIGHMLIRFILPEALFTGVLMLLIHLIFRLIYRTNVMQTHRSEDFKRL